MNWAQIDALHEQMAIPRLSINQQEAKEVKYIDYNFDDKTRFPKPLSSVELIHLTDMQIGAKAFQKKRFIEYRDWILSKPNRFVFLGGDVIDAATVISIASPYENTAEPIDQVDEAVEILKPLQKAGRLLGYVGGNHERRTIKTFGDCGRLIGRSLDVPYSRGVQLIDIKFGEHNPFRVSLWHGGGKSTTKGAIANVIHRFMQKADSQVYMIGHLHQAMVIPDYRQERRKGRIKLQKIFGIMSSSFLEYWNTYAEVSAMSPFDVMMGRVILESDGKWEVTLR